MHKIDSRIDSEISQVKAILEAFKAETVRYVAGILILNDYDYELFVLSIKNNFKGSLFTSLVIILGALRYFTV